jgi:hypothetical protein
LEKKYEKKFDHVYIHLHVRVFINFPTPIHDNVHFFIPIHDCVHVHDNAPLVHYHIPICDGDYVSARVIVCDNVPPFTFFYS